MTVFEITYDGSKGLDIDLLDFHKMFIKSANKSVNYYEQFQLDGHQDINVHSSMERPNTIGRPTNKNGHADLFYVVVASCWCDSLDCGMGLKKLNSSNPPKAALKIADLPPALPM